VAPIRAPHPKRRPTQGAPPGLDLFPEALETFQLLEAIAGESKLTMEDALEIADMVTRRTWTKLMAQLLAEKAGELCARRGLKLEAVYLGDPGAGRDYVVVFVVRGVEGMSRQERVELFKEVFAGVPRPIEHAVYTPEEWEGGERRKFKKAIRIAAHGEEEGTQPQP